MTMQGAPFELPLIAQELLTRQLNYLDTHNISKWVFP